MRWVRREGEGGECEGGMGRGGVEGWLDWCGNGSGVDKNYFSCTYVRIA